MKLSVPSIVVFGNSDRARTPRAEHHPQVATVHRAVPVEVAIPGFAPVSKQGAEIRAVHGAVAVEVAGTALCARHRRGGKGRARHEEGGDDEAEPESKRVQHVQVLGVPTAGTTPDGGHLLIRKIVTSAWNGMEISREAPPHSIAATPLTDTRLDYRACPITNAPPSLVDGTVAIRLIVKVPSLHCASAKHQRLASITLRKFVGSRLPPSAV